jgi:hypothetical protein
MLSIESIVQLVQLFQGQSWFNIVTAAVTCASAIAAVTPTPKAGTVLAKVYAVIDLLAINVGKAKQK